MRALEQLKAEEHRLANLGKAARSLARANGVDSYFIEKQNPDFITKERPDGSRAVIDRVEPSGKFAAE